MSAPWPVIARDWGVALDGTKPNPVAQSGGTGWRQSNVREPSNVIYDPDDADASRRWKAYVSGRDASSNIDIGVWFAPDGEAWTEHSSNPIISLAEDPYVVVTKDGTLYRDSGGDIHMFTEEKFAASTPEQSGIDHYTSADGVAWTADPANPVMEPADVETAAWETQDCTSPTVWFDDDLDLFFMLYEGRSSGDNGKIGVAWSADGSSWTRGASNPIIAPGSGFGSSSIVPNDIVFEHGRCVTFVHGKGTAYELGKFSTTNPDPRTWTSADWTSGPGTNPLSTQYANIQAFGGAEYGKRWLAIDENSTTPRTLVQIEATTHDPVLNNAAALFYGATAVDKIYLGSDVVWEPAVITMSGGTETTPGDGYKYHTFTAGGTLTVTVGGSVEYLVVGGGGGGGSRRPGGGGGGGAVLTGSTVISATQAIAVGAGGAGGNPTSDSLNDGAKGGTSSIGSLVSAEGGGYGTGGDAISAPVGGNGGCGGGAGAGSQTFTVSGGAGSVGGNGGSGRSDSLAVNRGGGGGGGASGVNGTNGSGAGVGGTGGAGVEWPTGSGTLYGGGGGGGGGTTSGTGGSGGGGNGGTTATSGATNRGGGGGGGADSITAGGAGGSGIVIIRYPI